MEKNSVESSLKRFLKRKVKITLGVIVSFMIMGTVSFGNNLSDFSIKYESGLNVKDETTITEDKDIYIKNTGVSITTSKGKLDLTGKDINIDVETSFDKETKVNSGIFVKNSDKKLKDNEIKGNNLNITNLGENKSASYYGNITDTGIMINPVLFGSSSLYNGKLTIKLENDLNIKNFTTGISSNRAGRQQNPSDTLNTELDIIAKNINLINDELLEKSIGIFFYSGAETKPVNENIGSFESVENLNIVNYAKGIEIRENGNKLFLGGENTKNINLKIDDNKDSKGSVGISTIKSSNSSNNSVDNAPFLKLIGKNLNIINYEKGIYNDGGNIEIALSNNIFIQNKNENKGEKAIYLNGNQYEEGAKIDIASIGNIYLSGYKQGVHGEGVSSKETVGNILSLKSEKGYIEISGITDKGIFSEKEHSKIILNSNFNNINSENIGIDSENHGKIEMTADIREKIVIDNEEYTGMNIIYGKEIGVKASESGEITLKGKDAQIVSDKKAVDISSGGNIFLGSSNFNRILGDISVKNENSLLKVETSKNQFTGDILTKDQGKVLVNFDGDNSSFTGSVSLGMESDGIVELGVTNNGRWNNTNHSSVTNLELNNGIIDLAYTNDNQDISIKNITGENGTFIMDVSTEDLNHTEGKTDFINIENADKTQIHFVQIGENSINGLANYDFGNKNPDKAIWIADADENITFEGKKFESVKNVFDYTLELDSNLENNNTSANGNNWYVTGVKKSDSDVTNMIEDNLSYLYNAGLSRLELDTLHKRMGEIRNYENAHGVWFRTSAGKMKSDVSDSSFKNDYYMLQVGYDTKTVEENGDYFTGLAVSRRESDIDYSNGNGDGEDIGVALYRSYAKNDGTYIDLVGRYTYIDTEYNVNSMKADYDTWAGGLSLEYGKKYRDKSEKWYVTPHAQLSYTYIDGADYKTSSGVKVEQDDIDSLIGRVGIYAGKDFEKSSHYIKASFLHEFMGDYGANITGADARIHRDLSGADSWAEVGIGGNFKVGKSGTTHIYYDIERTLGSDFETQWQGTLGIRISF